LVALPVGERLETLSDGLVLEDVKGRVLDASLVEDCDNLLAEAALGCLRYALHEEHDGGLIDELLKTAVDVDRGLLWEDAGEIAIGLHFLHDVEPADKVAIDVHLGERGPVRVNLETCARKRGVTALQ